MNTKAICTGCKYLRLREERGRVLFSCSRETGSILDPFRNAMKTLRTCPQIEDVAPNQRCGMFTRVVANTKTVKPRSPAAAAAVAS